MTLSRNLTQCIFSDTSNPIVRSSMTVNIHVWPASFSWPLHYFPCHSWSFHSFLCHPWLFRDFLCQFLTFSLFRFVILTFFRDFLSHRSLAINLSVSETTTTTIVMYINKAHIGTLSRRTIHINLNKILSCRTPS